MMCKFFERGICLYFCFGGYNAHHLNRHYCEMLWRIATERFGAGLPIVHHRISFEWTVRNHEKQNSQP